MQVHRWSTLTLLSVGLLDELQAGGPMLGASDLEGQMGLTLVGLGWALFAGPVLAGLPLESLVLLASDRLPRKPLLVSALLAMAATQLAVAVAPGAWTLAATLTLWGTATGVATGVAEGALVAAKPEDVDRTMARWALFGSVGDLAAPVLWGTLMALGFGWRTALAFGAALAVLDALAVLTGPPLATSQDPEEPGQPLLRTVFEALRNRTLLAWLGAATACTLLDELFVAFGTIYLHRTGASAVEAPFQIAGFAIGAAMGLTATERALRRWSAATVLAASAAACGTMLVVWVSHPTGVLGALAMVLLGASTAPQWPLSTARAYASAAGRPGLVAAIENGFVVVEILAVLAVGAIGDRFGLPVALVALLAQPLVVAGVAIAVIVGPRRSGVDTP